MTRVSEKHSGRGDGGGDRRFAIERRQGPPLDRTGIGQLLLERDQTPTPEETLRGSCAYLSSGRVEVGSLQLRKY